MPIITEKYADTRYGFLQGLGAAAPAPVVPILLADPKTGAFSNVRFEALKKVLIDAIQRAREDYAKTLAAASKSATELKDSLVRNTLPRLDRFENQVRAAFNASDSLWTEKKNYDALLGAIQQEIALFQGDAARLKVAADMSFYSALRDRAGVVLGELYQAGAGIIGPSVWFAKNLPWILGGAAVLLIAGPTIAGALKGGRAGAASAFESDIRSARGAIASGARGATKLFGAPKRRVSRRRRR